MSGGGDSDRHSGVFSHLTNTMAHALSITSPRVKGGIALPPTPPGLSGKDAEKWRKDMAKLLEQQRKEEQRMEKIRARDAERVAQVEAKMKRKADKINQKYGSSPMKIPGPIMDQQPRQQQQQPQQQSHASMYPLEAPPAPVAPPREEVRGKQQVILSPAEVGESNKAEEEEEPWWVPTPSKSSKVSQASLVGSEEVRLVLEARRRRIDEIEEGRAEKRDEGEMRRLDRRSAPLSHVLKEARPRVEMNGNDGNVLGNNKDVINSIDVENAVSSDPTKDAKISHEDQGYEASDALFDDIPSYIASSTAVAPPPRLGASSQGAEHAGSGYMANLPSMSGVSQDASGSGAPAGSEGVVGGAETATRGVRSESLDGKCGVGCSFELDSATSSLCVVSICSIYAQGPIQVGDEVMAIEGVSMKAHPMLLPSLVWGEPGTAMRTRVRRQGNEVTLTLIRRPSSHDGSLLTSKGGARTCGIGIVLDKELVSGYFYVKRVVEGGPAWAAGITQGDMMMDIDGVDLRETDKEGLPMLVVGPEGTSINVRVLNGSTNQATSLVIVRSLDTAKVQSSNLAMRLRITLSASCRPLATSSPAQLAQALQSDVVDALETTSRRVMCGRVTQGGRDGEPVYASVVLLPDFEEGGDPRGVEDLVREMVYQASNPRSRLRLKPTASLVSFAEVSGQVVGDEEEPAEAELQDYPEGYLDPYPVEEVGNASMALVGGDDEDDEIVTEEEEEEEEVDAEDDEEGGDGQYQHDLTASDCSSVEDDDSDQTSGKVMANGEEELDEESVSRRLLSLMGHPIVSSHDNAASMEINVSPPDGEQLRIGLMGVEEDMPAVDEEEATINAGIGNLGVEDVERGGDVRAAYHMDEMVVEEEEDEEEGQKEEEDEEEGQKEEEDEEEGATDGGVRAGPPQDSKPSSTPEEKMAMIFNNFGGSGAVDETMSSQLEQAQDLHDGASASSFQLEGMSAAESAAVEAHRLRMAHPDRVPVIIKRGEWSNAPAMGETKFLAKAMSPVEDFLRIMRRRPELANLEVSFALDGGTPLDPKMQMQAYYDAYKSSEDVLVLVYDLCGPAARAKQPLSLDLIEEAEEEDDGEGSTRSSGSVPRESIAGKYPSSARTSNSSHGQEDGFPPSAHTQNPPASAIAQDFDYDSNYARTAPKHADPPPSRDHMGEYYTAGVRPPSAVHTAVARSSEAPSGYVVSRDDGDGASWPPKISRDRESGKGAPSHKLYSPAVNAALSASDGAPVDRPSSSHPGCAMLPEGKSKAGIGMLIEAKKDGSGIRIAALAPGGAAEASNLLRVGDELVAVDGHSVKGRPTAHASTYITGATGVPVDLTVIRAGRLLTVSILRGLAPVSGTVGASSKRIGALMDERVQQVMGINSSLDAIQARLGEGYELPPVHDNFWEHAHIVRKFSMRARELLDEVDCAIGHCKAQQKALNEVSRMKSGSRDAASDKQHVFDCAQASCRIMSMMEEIEASRSRLLESQHFLNRKLADLDTEITEIVT